MMLDTTQATVADGLKMWINGVPQTLTETAWSQNYQTYVNHTVAQYFGRNDISTGSSDYVSYGDEYIAFAAIVDGQALDASAFGQFHPKTGQWRPKIQAAIRAVVAAGGGARNGWGTNGFFLPFDDTTSLTTLGYDRSQSDTDTTGNNWTATNISLTAGATYDSMLDTPTTNYATLNPLVKRWSNNTATITDGNLRAANTSISNDFVFGSLSPASGKWYFECLVSSVGSTQANFAVGVGSTSEQSLNFSDSVQYIATGQSSTSGAAAVAYGASYTTNDVIGVALDRDAGQVTFYKNNVSQGTLTLPTSAPLTAFITPGTSSGVAIANFGQRPFAYTPPTGFKALCAKNLPFPKIPKSSAAFVAVTDTGANIASTLAAARSGWPGYIDIIKRRDSAEGWRWIFSDDPSNYLDSSSTAAKAAVPAFGGTSYVGYSLKVSAANGVATGRLTHTNGVADVVSDGLGNARKMVFLKNEATGDWFVYHPELTAGKLLYLNQAVGETTDSTISAVTATGFTVSASLASGTYRWISIAETDGLIALRKHTGNASSDGALGVSGVRNGFLLLKNSTGGTSSQWRLADSARSKSNLSSISFRVNNSTAEDTTGCDLDLLSNGHKIRGLGTDTNDSGNSYVFLAIAEFPFRYANAR